MPAPLLSSDLHCQSDSNYTASLPRCRPYGFRFSRLSYVEWVLALALALMASAWVCLLPSHTT